MEKDYAVIPLTNVEKHFPVPRLPAYPNIPAYDLEKLTEWATEEGWSVVPDDAWSTKGHKIPGMRFTKLKNSEDIQTNSAQRADKWYKKPIGIVFMSIVAITFAGLFLDEIRHFLSTIGN